MKDKQKDVFGRSDPKIVWTDVPQDQYDQLMALPEDERNIRLARVEEGVLVYKRSPINWKRT